MKAILLNGSNANDNTGERVCAALTTQLQARGWEMEKFTLCERKIGNCAGDFFCFIRTPGVCNVNDDNRMIAEALVNCDLMVYLTPVRFGGFSSTIKLMVDHQIQNISPLFARVSGETHHAKRYKKNPDLLVVGWMESPNPRSEAVFKHLVQRMALNWHSKTWVGDVVLTSQSDDELKTLAGGWVDSIQNGKSSEHVELPTNTDSSILASYSSARQLDVSTGNGQVKIRRALLLVGSPKTRKSTSNSLGGYLFEGIKAHSVQTETIYLHTVLRNPKKMQSLLDAVDAADLVMLAFPIYCDSLPAPVIEAFERIAAHRQDFDVSHHQMFAAIANCGFPEAYQCDTALAICKIFAQNTGFEWVGGMALGGGGMVNGFPLIEGGGKTLRMRQSLDLAAEALAQGKNIPEVAKENLAKPIIPNWAYWLVSFQRWYLDAKAYSALKLLFRKPYLSKAK